MIGAREAYTMAVDYAETHLKPCTVSSMADKGNCFFFTVDYPNGTTCSEDGIVIQKDTGNVSEMAYLTAMITFESGGHIDIDQFQKRAS